MAKSFLSTTENSLKFPSSKSLCWATDHWKKKFLHYEDFLSDWELNFLLQSCSTLFNQVRVEVTSLDLQLKTCSFTWYCKHLQTKHSFSFSTRQPTNCVWISMLLYCDWTKAFWLFTTLNSSHRETATERVYKSLKKLKATLVSREGFAFEVQHRD